MEFTGIGFDDLPHLENGFYNYNMDFITIIQILDTEFSTLK